MARISISLSRTFLFCLFLSSEFVHSSPLHKRATTTISDDPFASLPTDLPAAIILPGLLDDTPSPAVTSLPQPVRTPDAVPIGPEHILLPGSGLNDPRIEPVPEGPPPSTTATFGLGEGLDDPRIEAVPLGPPPEPTHRLGSGLNDPRIEPVPLGSPPTTTAKPPGVQTLIIPDVDNPPCNTDRGTIVVKSIVCYDYITRTYDPSFGTIITGAMGVEHTIMPNSYDIVIDKPYFEVPQHGGDVIDGEGNFRDGGLEGKDYFPESLERKCERLFEMETVGDVKTETHCAMRTVPRGDWTVGSTPLPTSSVDEEEEEEKEEEEEEEKWVETTTTTTSPVGNTIILTAPPPPPTPSPDFHNPSWNTTSPKSNKTSISTPAPAITTRTRLSTKIDGGRQVTYTTVIDGTTYIIRYGGTSFVNYKVPATKWIARDAVPTNVPGLERPGRVFAPNPVVELEGPVSATGKMGRMPAATVIEAIPLPTAIKIIEEIGRSPDEIPPKQQEGRRPGAGWEAPQDSEVVPLPNPTQITDGPAFSRPNSPQATPLPDSEGKNPRLPIGEDKNSQNPSPATPSPPPPTNTTPTPQRNPVISKPIAIVLKDILKPTPSPANNKNDSSNTKNKPPSERIPTQRTPGTIPTHKDIVENIMLLPIEKKTELTDWVFDTVDDISSSPELTVSRPSRPGSSNQDSPQDNNAEKPEIKTPGTAVKELESVPVEVRKEVSAWLVEKIKTSARNHDSPPVSSIPPEINTKIDDLPPTFRRVIKDWVNEDSGTKDTSSLNEKVAKVPPEVIQVIRLLDPSVEEDPEFIAVVVKNVLNNDKFVRKLVDSTKAGDEVMVDVEKQRDREEVKQERGKKNREKDEEELPELDVVEERIRKVNSAAGVRVRVKSGFAGSVLLFVAILLIM